MGNKETQLQIVIDAQNRTQGAFDAVQANLDGFKKTNQGLITAMTTVGVAGAAAFGGLAIMTKGAVEAGAQFEQTNIAFNTMIGDAGLAQQTLTNLAQFASRTPFQLTQLEQASKQLLAYGISAKDLIPTLKTLGDIAAGVGMDKLPELILAFGQVQAKGHLAGQELLQFTNAGVGLSQQLQKDLGLTRDQFEKLMESGQITAAQVTAALNEMTGQGGLFFNLMDKQSQSLAGQWSNFHDQISLTARAIGEQLVPYLKPLVDQLIQVAQAVDAFATAHPKLTAVILIGTLAFTGLMAILLPIALALPGLVIMFGLLTAAMSGPALIAAVVVAAIAGITAALVALNAMGLTTRKGWEDVWAGIKVTVADNVNSVIGMVESMINFIIDGVNKTVDALNKVIALAQNVPGVGKLIPSIGRISAVTLGRVDTDTIATSSLIDTAAKTAGSSAMVSMSGNVFLSPDVAEQIGDMILGKLKLSNAL